MQRCPLVFTLGTEFGLQLGKDFFGNLITPLEDAHMEGCPVVAVAGVDLCPGLHVLLE